MWMESLSATDDHEWADRSRHWGQRGGGSKDRRIRRKPLRGPLILAGHGVSLRIEAGTLLIRNGFTHYPQKQETFRLFKGDVDLPPRIIMLDGSGSITFDC
jgi:CRISPR-associated protein Cas1